MKRVLVCEDDRGVRGFLDHFVRWRGLEVDTAADGLECLEKIEKGDYDAVLLDLMMPGLDGYEVLDYLRRSKLHVLKKTIVLTASTAALKSPPDDVAAFFAKPFDVHSLVAKLDSLLDP